MNRNTRSHKLALSCLLVAVFSPLHAEDFTVVSTIDQVKVFPQGAEITRVATINLPSGSHRLIIDDLPPSIDPARLQLAIQGGSISMGNLQMEERFQTELVSAEERRLQEELDELRFELSAVNDEIASVNTQLKVIDSLASGALASDDAVVDGSGLTSLLQTVLSSSSSARTAIREANRSRQRLDQEIKQKQAELAQVATRNRSQEVLSVRVEVAAQSEAILGITYPMAAAGWELLYESRLDTATKQLQLQRKVAVEQYTGEPWEDVAIEITTATPSSNTQTPQLGSLLVDFYRAPPPRQLSRSSNLSSRLESSTEEVLVTGSFIRGDAVTAASPAAAINAGVNATEYLVNFDVPGRVSVAANGALQIFHIDQRDVGVELITRTVPEVDATAYLEVRFNNDDNNPIQGGSMQLYRDGTYIGQQYVAEILPQEEVSLPFGVDDRVRVEVRSLPQESRDGGTFRRSAVKDHRTRYEITNFHADTIQLEVLGQIPVARNEAIEVEISDDASPADEVDVDGVSGVLMWKRLAAPNQTESILHAYSVSHPSDENLSYQRR